MTRGLATRTGTAPIEQRLMLWLYPRLRALPPGERPLVLEKARDTEFTTGEWVGIAGGLCFVAWLLDADFTAWAAHSRLLALLLQFLLALPLLALVVGPFFLNRTRRGIERELARGTRRAWDASPPMNREDL